MIPKPVLRLSTMFKANGERTGGSRDANEALLYVISTLDAPQAGNMQVNAKFHQDQVNSGSTTVFEARSKALTSAGPSFWPANMSTIETIPKVKKKRRIDRNRPIHEIQRLQTQVTDLEQHLKTLKPDAESLVLKEKNDTLKKEITRRMQDTAALKQMMQTHADKSLQALPKSLVASGQNLVYDIEEDTAVYQILAKTVDEHYLDMNRVLRAAGLNDATSEIFDASMTPAKTIKGLERVLKTRISTFLPFARNLIEQAMWHRLECESAILPENIESSNDLGLPLGTNASSMIVSKQEVYQDNATFTIRLALKEYIEADRSVYVWDAMGDSPQATTMPQVSTREYGWCYFMQTDRPELCVLRSFVMVTPTVAVDADEQVVEQMMQLYRRTVELRYQKFENTLLDASIDVTKAASSTGWDLCRTSGS